MDSNLRKQRVFVYGTLRRGDPSGKNAWLGDSVCQGTGRVAGRLLDLADYPGMIPADEPGQWVTGEIYEVSAAVLAELDQYEGCDISSPQPQEYRREMIPVEMENGESMTAWTYWFALPAAGYRRIASGDWLER